MQSIPSGPGATPVGSLDITSVFVTNWIIFNNNDGNNITLNGFSNDYFEGLSGGSTSAPEPGTFLLLGSTLGAVGFLKRDPLIALRQE